jgi:type IV secretion system protein VirD4
MYKFLRYVLIATVLLLAYVAALVIYFVPYAWLVVLGIGAFMLCRKTYHYTSHGSARWAEAEDLEGMIDE